MVSPTVYAAIASADLRPAPLARERILEGAPEVRNYEVAKSDDGTSYSFFWECTAGRFTCHFTYDETAVFLSGEVFVTDTSGKEHRLGPGDTVFFPAGTRCIWHVPVHVEKFAVVRQTLPRPLGIALRAWNRLIRLVGLKDGSPPGIPSQSKA
jgi:uncharacterized cupin superfamily protein